MASPGMDFIDAKRAQENLDQALDRLPPWDRFKFALATSDGPLYLLGFFSGLYLLFERFQQSFASIIISEAFAQAGTPSFWEQNYIPTLIFIAFLASLVGAIFGATPAIRNSCAALAKIFAGSLIGFVGGSAHAK